MRLDSLEQQIRRHLDDDVADEEDRERDCIRVAFDHVEITLQAGDGGLPDVDSVEEGEEVAVVPMVSICVSMGGEKKRVVAFLARTAKSSKE